MTSQIYFYNILSYHSFSSNYNINKIITIILLSYQTFLYKQIDSWKTLKILCTMLDNL